MQRQKGDLSDRTQYAQYKDICPNNQYITCGVPQ